MRVVISQRVVSDEGGLIIKGIYEPAVLLYRKVTSDDRGLTVQKDHLREWQSY